MDYGWTSTTLKTIDQQHFNHRNKVGGFSINNSEIRWEYCNGVAENPPGTRLLTIVWAIQQYPTKLRTSIKRIPGAWYVPGIVFRSQLISLQIPAGVFLAGCRSNICIVPGILQCRVEDCVTGIHVQDAG